MYSIESYRLQCQTQKEIVEVTTTRESGQKGEKQRDGIDNWNTVITIFAGTEHISPTETQRIFYFLQIFHLQCYFSSGPKFGVEKVPQYRPHSPEKKRLGYTASTEKQCSLSGMMSPGVVWNASIRMYLAVCRFWRNVNLKSKKLPLWNTYVFMGGSTGIS